MKKVKNVSLGDKVFAKVKGYPAWPARVEEDLSHGKKYKVYFYGTGETGVVKPEDIFGYLDHKEQFMKHAKRKDYSEAMLQIEAAIAEDDLMDDKPETAVPEPEKEEETTNRGMKRKLSIDSTSSESKKKAMNIPAPKPTKETEKSLEAMLSDEENELGYQEQTKNNNVSHRIEESSEDEFMPEISKKDTTPTKFKVVIPQTLRDIIEEFERCVKNAEKGNEKPEDGSNTDSQNEILLARVTPEKIVGIKLNHNRPSKPFETEVERLRWKESDARFVLQLKEKVEDGTAIPEDKPELYEFELELSEDQQREAIQDRIMERKRAKLKFLKTEANLVELDAAIKTNLALDKADPKEALKDLDVMLTLNIEPLMLKKHSHVMEMVKRLRRYIGNVKEWKLGEKELDEFKKDAELIRNKAEIVYKKFKALFTVPDEKSFWEIFNEECEKFKTLTKDMTENQMFILCAEPGTKQAHWDELDDQDEMKLLSERNSERNQKKVQENKENSSQVINTNSEETFAENNSAENPNLTNTSTDSHG